MSISLSVERRWSLKSDETLRLLPIRTHRMISMAHAIALFVGSILFLGIPFLWKPTLLDVIYYEFYHHKKIVRCQKPLFELDVEMNLHRFSSYLSEIGWSRSPPQSLKKALSTHRSSKLLIGKRIRKILDLFTRAQNQKMECYPKTTPQNAPIDAFLNICGSITYGTASSKGYKRQMEDLILTGNFSIQVGGKNTQIPSFILMDGHGIEHLNRLSPPGMPINHYIKENFFSHLSLYLNTYLKDAFSLEGFYEAFKAGLCDLNDRYPHAFSGSTFIGVFLLNDMLLCVSIGDSQAILFNHGKPISLNLVADPKSPYFKQKLEKKSIPVNLRGRIGEALNMAAALGDKNIVTPSGTRAVYPFISFTAVPRAWIADSPHLVIGSDGIFDWVNLTEIQDTLLKNSGLKEVSCALVKKALENGSTDNLSCIVLTL